MDEQKTSYRKYAEEFKLEALEFLKSSGKSAGRIERDLVAGEMDGLDGSITSHFPRRAANALGSKRF